VGFFSFVLFVPDVIIPSSSFVHSYFFHSLLPYPCHHLQKHPLFAQAAKAEFFEFHDEDQEIVVAKPAATALPSRVSRLNISFA
jgi:hypothetical protein